jgi:hypothetical protein
VAAVQNALADTGRLDNTALVYLGDNGMSTRSHRLSGKAAPYVTQVPAYLAWPAGRGPTPAAVDEPLQNIDLAPTLCELAGCVMGPYPNGQQAADGESFASLITNPAGSLGRDEVLDEMLKKNLRPDSPPWEAIRTTPHSPLGLWHYIEYADGFRELYDVSGGPCWLWRPGEPGDPCELQNLLAPGTVPSPASQLVADRLRADLQLLELERG